MHNNPNTQKNYRKKRRAERLQLINDGCCSKCKSADQKLKVLGNDTGKNIYDMSDEVFESIKHKLSLVCPDCDPIIGARKVIDKYGNVIVHGTISSYRYCRCEECCNARCNARSKLDYSKGTFNPFQFQ